MQDRNWETYIGDIEIGRKNLGSEMPVAVYRLFEFTMKEVLIEKFGVETAIEIFREAGYSAGLRFTKEMFDLTVDFNTFIANIQRVMKEQKIGILRLESVDFKTDTMVITVGEDLDCSGLPITGETVCNYDEGFLQGVLKAYTNKDYQVREIDCWANGGRVCRFKIHQ